MVEDKQRERTKELLIRNEAKIILDGSKYFSNKFCTSNDR